MTTGPHEARLRAVLATADAGVVDTAALEWGAGAQLLELVAGALENAAPAIGSQFGPETGGAAREAFRHASTKVRGRARLMSDASTALVSAHAALVHAERVRDSLGAPLSEPQRPSPTPGPSTPDDVAAQRAYDSARAGYDAAFSKRESDSAAATEQMDTVYTASTETMKKVHGEPDPAPRTPGGGGSGGGSASASTSTGGTPSGGGYRAPTGDHPTYTTTTSHTSDPGSAGTPGHTGPSGGPHPPSTGGTSLPSGPGQQPGTAQGGNDAYPSGPTVGTPVTSGLPPTGAGSPTGLTAPTAGGLAGAVGGGALGGLTGISGAVRGPSTLPTGGAAGAGGRAIGSTTRTGATGGTLGRSGTAGTTGEDAAAGSRGAGSRSAGRGAAGSRGAAGGRGSAGGQGGRKNKDPRKKNTDFFEEEQDWVEDEGAAPGVID